MSNQNSNYKLIDNKNQGFWREDFKDKLPTEPMFYFDGSFRTWLQVQRRAELNQAVQSMPGILEEWSYNGVSPIKGVM